MCVKKTEKYFIKNEIFISEKSVVKNEILKCLKFALISEKVFLKFKIIASFYIKLLILLFQNENICLQICICIINWILNYLLIFYYI